jgi:hypothetical protein
MQRQLKTSLALGAGVILSVLYMAGIAEARPTNYYYPVPKPKPQCGCDAATMPQYLWVPNINGGWYCEQQACVFGNCSANGNNDGVWKFTPVEDLLCGH